MPSNKELAKQIKEIDAEVETNGLNNAQLASTLKSLKTEPETEVETPVQDVEETTEVETVEENKGEVKTKPAYYVAPRTAITSKKGILSGDDEAEVKAEYLSGGKDALDSLVESGHVLKG